MTATAAASTPRDDDDNDTENKNNNNNNDKSIVAMKKKSSSSSSSTAAAGGIPRTDSYQQMKRAMESFNIEESMHSTSSPLHDAAEEDDVETIIALITIGANVNETDDSGMTPLTYAATWGNASAIAILLENGADVNHKDKVGDTALHEVCRGDVSENERYIECARVLLEDKNCDVDAKNELGATPLHVASHQGNTEMIELLCDWGASVTGEKAEMKGGYSALHLAAKNGSSSSLSALVDAGADIRLESKEPMVGAGGGEGGMRRNDSATALDIAEQNGQLEAVGVLKTASEREFERGGLFGEGSAPRKQPSFSGRSKQSEQRSKSRGDSTKDGKKITRPSSRLSQKNITRKRGDPDPDYY